ncbi:unnamed protein product [Colletotrichum noveboracense]|uniref:Uncharacterized protein n=1 Tax=Colletotrichum noveboracense TaxID=2664923 RepID=A0A9W4RTM1_9PEZI|nr:unnamed protein product [Colletotrichum noveboracense]
MSDQHYIDHQQDGYRDPVSQRCSPVPQALTNNYPDLNNSPPFNVTQNEPHHLLTPPSGISSPPSIHQNVKIMHHPAATATMYHSSPPANNRMCWTNHYDLSAPHSQAASPMPMNMHPEGHFEQNYLHAEPQIKDEIPEPPPGYPDFGSFGVSGQPDSDHGSLSPQLQSNFYPIPQDGVMFESHPLMNGADLTMAHQSPYPSAHQFPINAQPTGYPSQHNFQDRDDIMRRPSYGGLPYPSQQIERPVASPRLQPREQTQTQTPMPTETEEDPQTKPRVRRLARMRNRDDEDDAPKPVIQLPNQSPSSSSVEDEPATLIFKPSCPDQERWLFQRRAELEDQKGSGIWATITAEYNRKYNATSDIPRLQMVCSRGRAPYLAWHPTDDDKLRRAILFDEQQQMQRVFAKFKELGGGAYAHWGRNDLELRMVELGWADVHVEPSPLDSSVSVRRRRKLNRRQSTAQDAQSRLNMTEEDQAQVMEEIVAHRGIKPEDEDAEVTLHEMQRMRLQHPKNARVTKQETQESLIASGGRVAKIAKSSAAKAKSRSRVQRSKAA